MTADLKRLALVLGLCGGLAPLGAQAQDMGEPPMQASEPAAMQAGEAQAMQPADTQALQAGEPLMELGVRDLRGRVEQLYSMALARTREPGIVAADDSRFIWASEAKAQCGIAIGYLKSGYKDPISVGKCTQFAALMDQQQAPVVDATPVSTVTPEICRQPIAGTVFFEFDSAVPGSDAGQTIAYIANTMRPCGRTALEVTGHADRAGSDAYNDALSLQRAQAVAGMLTGAGVDGSALTVSGQGERQPRVPTPDGERNPQNRRVEITAK